MVKVVAHRGFSGKYPENTEIAFREAIELGVEMIEFDVHLAKDGALIVIHDATVNRTSNGKGRIADMTLAEIKALDAGAWLKPEFAGQRFPTLQEALDLMGGKVRLNIHVKAYPNDAERLVPSVVRELQARNLLDKSFVASDQEYIALARRIEPRLGICNLSTTPKETYVSRSDSIGCRILQPGNKQVDKALVDDAHAYGMEVNPFYADDEAEMRRLIECGVDGILTNYPDRLQQVRWISDQSSVTSDQ